MLISSLPSSLPNTGLALQSLLPELRAIVKNGRAYSIPANEDSVLQGIIRAAEEAIQVIVLQQQCLTKLNEENIELNQDTQLLGKKCQELSDHIGKLTQTISRLSQEYGVIQGRNEDSLQELKELAEGRQSLIKAQESLHEENKTLGTTISRLQQEKQDSALLRKAMQERLEKLEADMKECAEQSRRHLEDQKSMQQKLRDIEENNLSLAAKLDALKTERRITHITDHEYIDFWACMISGGYVAMGLLLSGGMCVGAVPGVAIYLMHRGEVYYHQQQIQSAMAEYAASHPGLSRAQLLEAVLKANRSSSK